MKCCILVCFGLFSMNASAEDRLEDRDTSSLKYIGLKEVEILASFAPPHGTEPVVLSTISKDRIATRLGNQEFPEILKSTPSIYTTKQGGGFGDSRLTLRGFGSENIALLVNGIPVTGMENGTIYWSNWAGLADVTNSIQVQRGIGRSKLGLFSVGGTVNIITQTAKTKQGGSVYYGIGNNGYQKVGFSLSSGQLSKGWAFSIMGSRTAGDGYVHGTNFEAWSYFASITKKIGRDHLLSLTALGAPQWHNRRSNKQLIEDYENHPDGIRMNTSYGYINGKVVGTYSGYNTYHKPQISLNHYWTIDSRSTLSTSVYLSNATGGGRKTYGKDANRLQYNYKNGRPYDNTSLTPDGLIDYLPVIESNRQSDHGSDAIFTMGTNSHDWYGLLSTYSNRLSDAFNLTVGIDARYYKGYHFDEISDLLGGTYFKDNKLAWRDPGTLLKVGDKVNQDYLSRIMWMGGFVQTEYAKGPYKAFLSLSLTGHSYKRQDPGKYGAFGNQSIYPMDMQSTKWQTFVPVSVKGGFNYRVHPNHNLFINGGYVTRAPMMENIFVDNTPLSNPIPEKIGTVEIGYGFNLDNLHIGLNGYYTKWLDKSVTKAIGSWNGPRACIPNIDARHMGIEFEATYRPVEQVLLNGFFTVGDWRWVNDVNFTMFNEANEKIGDYNAFIRNLHVGSAPQTSLMLGATYLPTPGLSIGVDYNYYARHYADFVSPDRTHSEDRSDSWKLPNYATVDLNLNYNFRIGTFNAQLTGNVYNLFNKKYISDALDGSDHTSNTALVWYGFGITWCAGLRISF